MPDTSLNEFALDGEHPILLVTTDRALALLISTEAAELALPLEVTSSPTRHTEVGQPVIADLDSREGLQTVISADEQVFIGVCTRAADVPPMLRAGVLHLVERPFSTAELRTLLGALRVGVAVASVAPKAAAEPVLFGEDGTVLVQGEPILLTPKEAVLLQCLLEHRGEVVTKRQLAECLDSDHGASNEAEVYLCHLRRKLEKPTGRRIISTVRGVGYRLEWK